MNTASWIMMVGVGILATSWVSLRISGIKTSWDRVLLLCVVLALLVTVMFPGCYNPKTWGL